MASFYASMLNGRPTASGESFDVRQKTAAHLTLPFGTMLEVRRLDNQRSVVVRVNDRGPYVRGRFLDLSPAAARVLEMGGDGVAEVEITVLGERLTSSSPGGPGAAASGEGEQLWSDGSTGGWEETLQPYL